MSNPTTLVSAFDGDLSFADQSGSGTWAGVDPIRYDDGLWLEEGATSHIENPIGGNGATGYNNNFIEVVSLPGPLPYDYLSGVTQCSRVTATGDRGAYGGIVTTVAFEVPDTSEYTISALIWVPSSYGGTGIRLTHQNFSGAAATEAVADMGKRDQWQRIGPVHLDIDADRAGNVTLQNLSGTWLTGQTLYFVFMQTTKGGYATSPIAGSLGPGFSWSGTPHGAFIASIRAASSASVTIAEPVSVACWYREAYSGAKQFVYLSSLGALGTYGSIAYAAGDLTISTTRNLVIGPFAAFSRALTATEQANLKSTQNWSMNSVNGSNIILPLSGRRRPR